MFLNVFAGAEACEKLIKVFTSTYFQFQRYFRHLSPSTSISSQGSQQLLESLIHNLLSCLGKPEDGRRMEGSHSEVS